MTKIFIIAYIAIFLNGAAQILLKKGALVNDKFLLSIYLNKFTILGYTIFFIVTLVYLYVYRFLPLKYGVIFLPVSYITVVVLSKYFLKEELNKQQIIGVLFILLGIIIFNIP